MIARLAPLVGALLLSWRIPQRRKSLLVATACMTLGVIFTLVYIYRINDVLFVQAGANHNAEEIREMVSKWIWADRIRFGIGLIGFLALLRAFSISCQNNR